MVLPRLILVFPICASCVAETIGICHQAWLVWLKMGFANFWPGLTLNHGPRDSSDLHLLSSWNYRQELCFTT
jgi:hypothetical protein